MEARWIEVCAAAAVLGGCAGRVDGATPSDTAAPAAVATSATTPPVMLDGRVVGSDGASLPGVDVVRLALDPYVVPVLHARSDTTGSFVVGPVSGDSREWLTFQMPGHVNLYEAFDTGAGARQAMPAALLPTENEGQVLAQRYGVTLDPTRSVLRIPVVIGATGSTRPAPAGTFEVTFVPSLDSPVVYADGEAIAFNAASSGDYEVTVRSGGRACAPTAHPGLAEPGGSVKVGALEGFFTMGPAIACP